MSRLTRDGTAETVSRDQILRRERGQRNIHFSCAANPEQDGQPYPVDPYSCYMCDHTYIHYTNSGCRKKEAHCAGGLTVVNAVCTLLRAQIDSRLTPQRLTV